MATNVTIKHNDNIILAGSRTPTTKLWQLDIQPLAKHTANAAIGTATPADLVAFAHAAMFSPVMSTMAKAMQHGYLPAFAGLTLECLQQHPLWSIAMHKGHMDQDQMNTHSTKTAPIEDEPFPVEEEDGTPMHACYTALMEPTGQTYMDLTRKFVAASSNGNNYLLIIYDYDSNAILAIPLKNCKAESIINAYKMGHARLCATGLKHKLQCLDNEASQALQEFLTNEGIDCQLVLPHLHHHNAAEWAIQTFKNHFIAGLCSTDKDFPIHLWDRLVPQAELTLNLLRGSRLNPKISAWAQLHGAFNFNWTPIVLPGMWVLIHEKPSVRGTWAPHAVDGWYLGPALHSYQCYTVWSKDTHAQRICDTLTWLPSTVTVPTTMMADYILAGITDIANAL